MAGYPRRFLLYKFIKSASASPDYQLSDKNIEYFFKELVSRPIRIPHGRNDYIISEGDFSIREDGKNRFVSGRIGKTKAKITEQIYNNTSKSFETVEVTVDGAEGASFTNFLYYFNEKILFVQENISLNHQQLQIFFNHGIEKVIGKNTLAIEPIFESDIDSIIESKKIKSVEINLSKPNPIDPENISAIKAIFENSKAERIKLSLQSDEYVIEPESDETILHSINLAIAGYGKFSMNYMDEFKNERIFNTEKDIFIITSDPMEDDLLTASNWISANIESIKRSLL